MAVDRADVCVIVIDAEVGFTEQDSKLPVMLMNREKRQ